MLLGPRAVPAHRIARFGATLPGGAMRAPGSLKTQKVQREKCAGPEADVQTEHRQILADATPHCGCKKKSHDRQLSNHDELVDVGESPFIPRRFLHQPRPSKGANCQGHERKDGRRNAAEPIDPRCIHLAAPFADGQTNRRGRAFEELRRTV